METMMTINETAKHCGVSVNTIYRRLQSGLLMGNKVGNKWWINVGSPSDTTDANHANVTDDGNDGDHANDGQISELHRLLAQTALNAAPGRPWWRFWR